MALVFLIDVSVLLFLTLVGRIKLYLLLFISREYTHFLLGGIQLIKLGHELGRFMNMWLVLCEGSIEAEVKVAHEEIDVGDGIRFDHIFLVKEPNVLQDALSHRQSLLHCVLTRLKMTVDEAESCVVERELDHDSALPPVTYHIFHYVVLSSVAHEPAVKFLNEND